MIVNSNEFELLIKNIEIFLQENYKVDFVTESEESDYDNEISDITTGIKKILLEMDTTFSSKLFSVIKRHGLNEAEVYKRADIDKRLFSYIRRDENYRPKKTNIILLCLSMELSLEETTDLLEWAGYCFSDSIEFDQIARYFFQNKIYDIYVYRDVLYRFGLMGEKL